MKVLKCNPDLNYSSLSEDQKERLLLCYEMDNVTSESNTKFLLNIIFNPIELNVPSLAGSKKYYFGLRRASVEINAPFGKYIDSTPEEGSITKIEGGSTHDKGQSIKDEIGGTIGSKNLGIGTSISSRSGGEKSSSRSTKRQFDYLEKPLVRTKAFSSVKWEKSKPYDTGEYSNILEGNLELFAEFEIIKNRPMKGTLILNPIDLKVCDSHKQIPEKFKSLAMILIFIKRFQIEHNPITVNFEIDEKD